jgi:hypothetical protein
MYGAVRRDRIRRSQELREWNIVTDEITLSTATRTLGDVPPGDESAASWTG